MKPTYGAILHSSMSSYACRTITLFKNNSKKKCFIKINAKIIHCPVVCCNSLSSEKVRAIPYALTLASIGIFLAFDTSDDRQEDMIRGVLLFGILKLLINSDLTKVVIMYQCVQIISDENPDRNNFKGSY